MKTMKTNMVSLFLVIGFFGISVNGNSQNIKLSRQEKKEARKAELAANFTILDSLLNARSFVLEADYLRDYYGEVMPVLSTLNFIRVNDKTGVLQTGSNFRFGYNGVGGVTAEGNIESWEIFKNFKNFSYTIRFSLSTNIGHYDVLLNVNADNHASATITGLGSGQLTWDGHLETLDNSRVFKGQNII